MCQAFAGESAYLSAKDRFIRFRGYEAQQAGVPRHECPEQEHPNPEYSEANQWRLGWDTAENGRSPW